MPNLPDEIIFDILSRLPVVSLCKFRCVSRPWRSLISHPHFIRTHLDRNTKLKHESLILIFPRYLYSVELESSQFGDQSVAVLLNFPLDRDPIYCDQVYGSCDGLVLMLDRCLNCSLVMVNPSTREVRKLPESPFNIDDPRRGLTDYGFGYDSSIDDYKIVSICNYNNAVCVYALKANSWRRIENTPYKYIGCRRQSAAFVCGALHWLASNGTDDVIVALGLADEKFRTVPSPGCIGDELCVLGGCLCVLVAQTHPVDVWVMKKYGVRDSWTKFTVTYHDNFQPWRPLSLSSTGQILFDTERSQLVVFDPWEEKCKELVVQGCPKWAEGGTYGASLVSPNRETVGAWSQMLPVSKINHSTETIGLWTRKLEKYSVNVCCS